MLWLVLRLAKTNCSNTRDTAHKYLPTLENSLATKSGEPGWLIDFLAHDESGNPTISVEKTVLHDTRVKLNDFLPKGLGEEWSLTCTGNFIADANGPFEWGLTVAGRAKMFLDGKLVVDNWTSQRPGEWFVSDVLLFHLGF